MTRITLTIAAVAIAASTLFASGAQACISCEYVPEVVHAGQKKAARKQQMHVAKPTPKKRIAKTPSRPKKSKKYDVAKAPAPKKVETAKAPQTAKPVETAKAETTETEKTETTETAAESTPATEPREKPISTAAVLEGGGISQTEEQPVIDEATTCKKFFPAVGMTLSVPCE
jgi:hypothetical protein